MTDQPTEMDDGETVSLPITVQELKEVSLSKGISFFNQYFLRLASQETIARFIADQANSCKREATSINYFVRQFAPLAIHPSVISLAGRLSLHRCLVLCFLFVFLNSIIKIMVNIYMCNIRILLVFIIINLNYLFISINIIFLRWWSMTTAEHEQHCKNVVFRAILEIFAKQVKLCALR